MKAEVYKFFLTAAAACFLLGCMQSPVFGQCGVPGTPSCRPGPPVVKVPSNPPPRGMPKIPVPRKPTVKEDDISRLKKEDISGSDALIDQFEKISEGDLKARLDNFFVDLMNGPNTVGIVVVYGKDREMAARISSIKKYISTRKLDAKRIEYRRGSPNKGGFLTKFYRRSPH
jgi:hypothetical protein